MLANNENLFFQSWKKQLVIYICICLCLQFLTLSYPPPFYMTFLLVPLIFIATKKVHASTMESSEQRFRLMLFVISLIVRVVNVFIMVKIFEYFNQMPYLGGDDYHYQQISKNICDYWSSGVCSLADSEINNATGAYSGFPIFGAIMMKFFGESIYSVRLGNAFVSALTVLIAYDIMLSYSDRKKARLAAWVFSFYPLFVIFSGIQWKDTILLFLALLFTKSIIYLSQSWWPNCFLSLLMGTVSLILLLFFRPAVGVLLLLSLGVLVFFLCFRNRTRQDFMSTQRMFVYGIIISLIFFPAWSYLTKMGYASDADEYITQRYENTGQKLADMDTQSSALSIAKILGTPVFAAASLFLPVFTAVKMQNNYSAFNSMNESFLPIYYHITLLPCLIMTIWRILREKETNMVPLLLIIFCTAYKLLQAFARLSLFDARQSMPAMALMLLLLPKALENPRPNKIYSITFLIVMFILVLYNLTKMHSRGMI